ncbi:MAG: HAD-IA family hydrolase [Bacteroidia bacterium]|nr:HAD-IA family hydrolase [Bacteroidia bacterium]
MTKAVIFDMDGILIDSEPLWREAMMRIFEQYGFGITEEQCRSTKGMKIEEVISLWNRQKSLCWEDELKIKMEIHKLLLKLLHQKGKAIPGAMDAILAAKTRRFKIGLATSSDRTLMEAVVKKLGVTQFFDAMVCADGALKAKPHPDVYLECAKRMGVSPRQCVAVEDSYFGLKSARSAGMFVIGVPESECELVKFRETADLVLENLWQVQRKLLEIQ